MTSIACRQDNTENISYVGSTVAVSMIHEMVHGTMLPSGSGQIPLSNILN